MLSLLVVCARLLAQESSLHSAPSTESPVRLGSTVVFSLKQPVGGLTVEERARLINARLERIVRDPKASPEEFEVGVDKVTGLPFVRHKRYQGILFTITPQDSGERSPLSLATDYAEKLRSVLQDIRLQQQREQEQRQRLALRREYARGTLYALLYTGLLPVIWFSLRRALQYVEARIQGSRRLSRGVHWREIEVLSAERLQAFALRTLALVRLGTYLLLLIGYLQLVLGAFPATRSHSRFVQQTFGQALSQVGQSVVDAVPGLINIALIVIVARLVLRGFEALMSYAETGSISLEPYIPHEFLRPTRSLGKFLIILIALFFIAPNIPGAGSDFAKVFTVFLGVIVSFSSTTTVGNFLAGIVLAYMRPFRRGDRVRIGDVLGDVVDSSFLYTRLRTPKNEEVLIPSLQILSGTIVNYSSIPEGVILHTQVSIGYDTPRARVEQLLLEAASRTEGCEQQPPPFVLVRSLDDSYITYELNVYTHCAQQMQIIYSRLHQNIKDVFDAAHVEIMSPHYVAVRDGNRVTIPETES